MNSEEVALAIAENERFRGIGITMEELEDIMLEAEKLFAFGRVSE